MNEQEPNLIVKLIVNTLFFAIVLPLAILMVLSIGMWVVPPIIVAAAISGVISMFRNSN